MGAGGHRIYTLNLKESARLFSETITITPFPQTIYEETSHLSLLHELIRPGTSTLPNVVSLMGAE